MNTCTRLLAILVLAAFPAAVFAAPAAETAAAPAPAVAAVPAEKQAPQRPEIRIGFVDLRDAATGCDAGKAATAEMKSKSEKVQATVREKEKQLDKLKKFLEEKGATLSPEKRAAKAKEFQKKIEEFRSFVQKSEKDLQGREEELTKNILSVVDKVVSAYGKKAGYDLIVAKRDILYTSEGTIPRDVTPEIIQLVNAEMKK